MGGGGGVGEWYALDWNPGKLCENPIILLLSDLMGAVLHS